MVAVAAAKFETLASTKNTLAPLRVRDSKIKTKKTCQKNKNCYLASMNNTLDDLRAEYPQYRFTIDKMAKQGKSFEEIEDHILALDEMD